MGRPTKSIALQYSNDGGVTFSTALQLKVKTVRVRKEVRAEEEANSLTGRLYEIRYAYLIVEFETDEREFDPDHEASPGDADANWLDIQNWCDADTRRMYNDDTTNVPNLDGYTQFNSNTNTNYLNLLSMSPNFRQADEYPGGKRARSMVIEAITREAV